MSIPPWQFQRAYTPPLMKRLLQITCIVTFVGIVFNLQHLLVLSPLFYTDFYFWQPLTSIFMLPSPALSFGFIIDFAFCMLVLWLFGSIVLERIGKAKFLTVYFLSGILSGLTALAVMDKFQIFTGMSELMPVILALTTLWAMIDPYQEILVFFILPLKAKWVLVVGLVGTLLVSFLSQDIVSFAAYFTAFIFSYFWGLFVLGLRSPFDWMTGLDRAINKIRVGTSRFWQWNVMGPIRKSRESSKAKEDAFVDATLEKISKEGTSSLSAWSRLRLKWISLKKRFGI